MTLQVVVPSYNCTEWIGRCLDSIKAQSEEYEDFDVVVIDDASPDAEQRWIIQDFCDALGWRYRFNNENMGAGYNIYAAIHFDLACEFDDPIIIVDGDDFLANDSVLARVAEIYADPYVWMMWSQYTPHPHSTGQTPSADYPPNIVAERAYRDLGNLLNHMITFRTFLFKESVAPLDLMVRGSEWAKAGYDRMICVPMLERAGPHARFVDEVMYRYNAVNPMSDVHVRLDEALEAARVVGSLPKKPPLEEEWVRQQRAAY